MPSWAVTAIVSGEARNSLEEEDTVPSNDRTYGARAAVPGPWLVATAAALGMLAVLAFLLLRPAASSAAPAAARTVVKTAQTSLGRILVNSRGHTLYQFEKDRNGKSACVGMCATFWPPLITSGKPLAASGARASLLGTTKRADGRIQVTYNHHPLYTFVKDTKKGQTNGEGVTAFGAQWEVNSPAGTKIEKHTPPPAPGYGP
jgi:predicted lipoprotein with Yx(FWY)xxD motif